MYNKAQAIKDGRSAIQCYTQQKHDLIAESSELRQALARLNVEWEQALTDLAVRLLPRLDRTQVERACAELDNTLPQGVLHRAERRDEANHQRILAIDANEEFAHRGRLLHPQHGTYTLELNRTRALREQLETQVATYDFKAFHWLFYNGYHLKRQPNSFQRFLRNITLAPLREKRALAAVQERLGDEDFAQLAGRYQELSSQLEQATGEFNQWQAKAQFILNLLEERQNLEQAICGHESKTLNELHASLVDVLKQANMTHIHDRIRPAARPLVAKAAAIAQKQGYLRAMQQWTEAEAQDRQQRILALERVINKWQRKPYGYLNVAKTRWLVQLPQQKQESTAKKLNWVGGLRHNFLHFSDYVGYSILMHEMGAAMMPYDAFGMHAHTRLPPEVFTRSLFSDLDLFRETYRMGHADVRTYQRIVGKSGNYVETDWEIWDEDDYYESDAAEALAEDWSDRSDEGDLS